MQTMHLLPGTPEWTAHRARHFNASDAPAMLGCSPYKTRSQLLDELHTGIHAEHDAATARRFADGHRFEALARPLAEQIIGDDLAPVVGTLGELSASFDGLTLMGDTAFEHKTLNDELRAVLAESPPALPKHYRVQMEQQLLVSGAERVLFMASKWDGDTLVEERHCWYYPDPALRKEIVAGWAQFALDLANYKHVAHVEPVTMGRSPETLPALRIEVTGLVTASNLDAFKSHALAVFAGINRNLSTDAEFADAEKTVKWCADVEDRLKAAKQHALSQTESIDTLFRAIDEIGAEARTVRLELDKLVKARKERIRIEEVQRGKDALASYIVNLNGTIGHRYMPVIPADFAAAISGKKTIDSVRAAIDQTLANAKIAASEVAGTIQFNLRYLRENAADHASLFPDIAQIALKAPDDFQALVAHRLAEHKAAEEKKEAEQRERIRAEEALKLSLEQAQRDREAARQAAAAAAPAQPTTAAPVAAPAAVSQAPAVVPIRPSAAPASPPTMTLGAIGKRLGFAVTADFLRTLGCEPAARDRSAVLYHEQHFPLIVDALVRHLQSVRDQRQAA